MRRWKGCGFYWWTNLADYLMRPFICLCTLFLLCVSKFNNKDATTTASGTWYAIVWSGKYECKECIPRLDYCIMYLFHGRCAIACCSAINWSRCVTRQWEVDRHCAERQATKVDNEIILLVFHLYNMRYYTVIIPPRRSYAIVYLSLVLSVCEQDNSRTRVDKTYNHVA